MLDLTAIIIPFLSAQPFLQMLYYWTKKAFILADISSASHASVSEIIPGFMMPT